MGTDYVTRSRECGISASSSGTIIISIAFDRGYYQCESLPIRERIPRKELSYGKIPLSWDFIRSFGRLEGNQFFNSSLPVGLPAQSNYAAFSKSVPEIFTRRSSLFCANNSAFKGVLWSRSAGRYRAFVSYEARECRATENRYVLLARKELAGALC